MVAIVSLVGRFESGGKAAARPVALLAIAPVASLALLHITDNGATALAALALLAIERILARAC